MPQSRAVLNMPGNKREKGGFCKCTVRKEGKEFSLEQSKSERLNYVKVNDVSGRCRRLRQRPFNHIRSAAAP